MPVYPEAKIASLDIGIPLAEFTADERAHFDAYWDVILPQYESVLYNAIQPYRERVEWLIRAVKAKIERSVKFEGQLPTDQNLGISFVKPEHIHLGSTPANVAAVNGDAMTVKFPDNWVQVATGQMHEEAGVVLFGIIAYSNADVIDGIRFTVGQRTLPPVDLSKLKLADNKNGINIWKFDTIYILPKDTYTIELHSDKADSANPPSAEFAFLGFTVGTGAFLKQYF